MEMENMLTTKEVVIIQPSWNGKKAEEVELKNGKNLLLSGDKKESQLPLPIDKYNIVFFILVLHGIGTLMPWNMFITAKSYFSDYKLNKTIAPEEYSKNFLSYHGLAAQLPNLICNGLNIFVQTRGSLTKRITICLILELGIFILTIALAIMDSTAWPGAFFWITMFSVVILNMANGVYQNCVYGTAADLPMKYSNAVVLGSNISGVLTSFINIITIAISPDTRTAAIYYFLTALLVLFLCIDTYFALPLCKFYSFHSSQKKPETASNGQKQRPPYKIIFRQIWPQCLNVFLVFFVTLAVFPAVTANVETAGNASFWNKYFVPVACFLTFNVTAMLGNLLPSWITYPGPDKLWIPVVSRFIFLPFFFFCNYKPASRRFPVYINSDIVYITGGSLLGLTSGYFSSLCMMYAPRAVKPEYGPTAGMMAAFFLILGIFTGINFSFVISWLAELKLS